MTIKYGYEIDLASNSTASKVIKLIGEGKKVLEFGCSYGYMSKVLIEKFNCSVIGVEIDNEAAQESKKICERVIVGNAEEINWSLELHNETFDVIVFADVLEHLRDPWGLLNNLRKYLKAEGYIVASIPNIAYLGVIVDLIHGEFDYRPLGILDDTHLRFFTLKSIREMFEKSGFVVEAVDRSKVPVGLSEFSSIIDISREQILEYLRNSNPEADTYQFVIKAHKSNENMRLSSLVRELEELRLRTNELKLTTNELNVLRAENKELKDYVGRIEKDIKEVNEYAHKLEGDISELSHKGKWSNLINKK